jgi:hypothetical protein
MSSSTLEQVLEKVKELAPEEQQKVRELLNSLASKTQATGEENKPLMTEKEFERYLLAKGVIQRIPARKIDVTANKNRKRIKVKGKPLSQTIIEERR